jgi:putative glycosyltransferase
MRDNYSESGNLRHADLSIVSTMYKSAEFINEFYRRITASATKLTTSYELILVNDGSPDGSLEIAVALAETDSHVRVIELSRNFGHHTAMFAGLQHARGNLVFLIDIDLEEQPEWLLDFWADLHETGADMVYGVQTLRSGSIGKRYTGSLFYRFFNLAAETRIPTNGCTIRLMKRRYVEAVTQFMEAHLFMMGLFSWAGFEQRPRYVTKIRRPSESSYTPLRLIRLSVDAVTSFSSFPLTVVFVAGVGITLLSLAYACGLMIVKLLHPDLILSGFTSIMVSLWFIGGTVISVLGLIGMYVGKIFIETKRRPQYFVRNIYEARETLLRTGDSGRHQSSDKHS